MAYRNQVLVHWRQPVWPVVVWLADRRCEWVCTCPCHQKPQPKSAPMDEDEAVWVREHVWTQHMRRTHETVPRAASTCACQSGPTQHCQRDHHHSCDRAEALPGPEGYITRPTGQVVSLSVPYEHPTPSAAGAHRVSAAQVWLADRVCAWQCNCKCHPEPGPEPEPEPVYEQPVLF